MQGDPGGMGQKGERKRLRQRLARDEEVRFIGYIEKREKEDGEMRGGGEAIGGLEVPGEVKQ